MSPTGQFHSLKISYRECETTHGGLGPKFTGGGVGGVGPSARCPRCCGGKSRAVDLSFRLSDRVGESATPRRRGLVSPLPIHPARRSLMLVWGTGASPLPAENGSSSRRRWSRCPAKRPPPPGPTIVADARREWIAPSGRPCLPWPSRRPMPYASGPDSAVRLFSSAACWQSRQ